MLTGLELDRRSVVLEVAAGTGQVARELSPHVRVVLALDATQAMLDEGKRAGDAEGASNLVFMRGDAARLPFADHTFDVVVCRYALHHFEEPAVPLAEMVRCLRPGGQLAVADLVAADSPDVAARQDELERIRDPSHTSLLSTAALGCAVEAVGTRIANAAAKETRRPLGPWLEQTGTARSDVARIVSALEADIAGGWRTGFSPERDDGGMLTFVQHFAAVVARPISTPN